MARSLLFGGILRRLGGRPLPQAVAERAEGAALRLLFALAGALPLPAASALGAGIGALLGPRLRKHRHVLANLACAFPELDAPALHRLARASWAHAGRVLAEFPHVPELVCGRQAPRVAIEDRGGLAALREGGRGGLLVTAHVGNWYLTLALVRELGERQAVVFREQRNPHVEAVFARWRARLPLVFLPVGRAGSGIARALVEGRSVGVLLDQRYDRGEAVPFFGIETPTATAPLRAALRLGLPVVPVEARREGAGRHRVIVHPPLAVPEGGSVEARTRALALAVNRTFEAWIRARPEQWLCLKRRFPEEVARRRLRELGIDR